MYNWIYKLQQSKHFIAAIGLILVVWLGYNTTLVILRNYELVQQIEKLESQIAVLELENENLKYRIGYFRTDAFLELEARDKLQKVEPGEHILVLPDNRYDSLPEETEIETDDDKPPALTNFQAWLDFLTSGIR